MTDLSQHRICHPCSVRWKAPGEHCWMCGNPGEICAAYVVPGSYQHAHNGLEEDIA